MTDRTEDGPRVVLVTGPAGGIGSAICTLLEQEGWQVVATDIAAPERSNVATAGLALEVTSSEAWRGVVAPVVDKFGHIDGLVNVAGIARRGMVWEASDEDWDDVVAVNQTGVFYGIRAVAAPMREAGSGSIVNISSNAGLTAFTNAIGYVASKFAVTGMTKAAALELGEGGIRVNSVHPGVIDTDLPSSLGPRIPINRFGQVSEIAELVLFLLSDRSSYCTGAEFVADGGLLAGRYRH
jgi:3alpha(or 20beta)-hydroxysteroid dehydrogenase